MSEFTTTEYKYVIKVLLTNWTAFLPSTGSCKTHVTGKERHKQYERKQVLLIWLFLEYWEGKTETSPNDETLDIKSIETTW